MDQKVIDALKFYADPKSYCSGHNGPDVMRDLGVKAKDALAAEHDGWQLIETAPRDGTRVLGVVVRDDRRWMMVVRTLDKEYGWYTDPGKHHVIVTHWMPLPVVLPK
jgi:hypothetical protein